MTHAYRKLRKPAFLASCLALGLASTASAQMTSGAGLSSGSGAGTGSGFSTGVQRNRSGSLSGVGPGSNDDGLRGPPIQAPAGGRRRPPITSFGPGVDVSFPNDPYLLPFIQLEQGGAAFDKKIPTHITNELLKNARMIVTPEERSLALQRLASGAIASRQLFLAHQLLEEAITATSEVTIPLVRDQRLMKIVETMTLLTDATLLQGRQILNESPTLEADSKLDPLPKGANDPVVLIRTARLEWKRALYLSQIIGNPTYRNEMMYKVAENMASGSASIANEFIKPAPTTSPSQNPPPPAPPAPPAPKPGEARPLAGETPRRGATAATKAADNENYRQTADAILIESFDVAKKIDRLIWKYRAMARIALLAADSQQYSRGFELAKGIANGESRAEAMLLLAEAQARDDQNDGATAAYEEAAKAVATVQQDGLRGVLAGFVVDSLIASGRFQDARKCIVLYPDPAERLVALGAIAHSQGKRGSADAARKWIAAEVSEEYRPILYRHVTTGVLTAIEQNRSKEFIPTEAP
jgi:hypothetical protein